jgi:hypothetical protein
MLPSPLHNASDWLSGEDAKRWCAKLGSCRIQKLFPPGIYTTFYVLSSNCITSRSPFGENINGENPNEGAG